MKRIATVLLASLALTIGPLGATSLAARDARGPACADIIGNSGQSYYTVDAVGNPANDGILSLQIETAAPLCSYATLTVYVSTDGTTFTAYTYPGDPHFTSCGESCLTFRYDYGSTATSPSAAPTNAYVYLETSIKGHVVDRAPNNGAPPLTVCDANPTTVNYDSSGSVIPPCNPPGGEYFL